MISKCTKRLVRLRKRDRKLRSDGVLLMLGLLWVFRWRRQETSRVMQEILNSVYLMLLHVESDQGSSKRGKYNEVRIRSLD